MAALMARKSLACLSSRHCVYLCKFHVSFSLSYSTNGRKQQGSDAHPTISEFLMQRHHFSAETAARVNYISARPKTLERFDSVISFLKETGLSNMQLEKAVDNCPRVLSVKLEKTIKPIIRVFRDFGFTSDEIAEIVSKTPKLFKIGADKFTSSLSVLKRLLGSNAEVAKFLKNSGNFFCALENNLVPNIEFLKSRGIPMERIKMLMRMARVLLNKPETLRKIVQKAADLGFDMSSPNFIYAVKTVSSMSDESWELKLEAFRKLGFSDDDILRVFRYSPLVFAVSEKRLKKVKEVLLETGKYDMPCIVNNPTVFQYSIEKRFQPRLQVLTILEKKNLIKEWPSLGTLHLVPNDKFFEKFVAPYLDEVGDVWSAVSHGNGEVKL